MANAADAYVSKAVIKVTVLHVPGEDVEARGRQWWRLHRRRSSVCGVTARSTQATEQRGQCLGYSQVRGAHADRSRVISDRCCHAAIAREQQPGAPGATLR